MQSNKKFGQKHQNKKSFKLKYKEKQIEQGKQAPLDRLCEKCLEQIKWKIQFGKYKVASGLRRCVKCQEKNINKSYRQVCNKCSDAYKICSKCCEVKQLSKKEETEGIDYKLLHVMENYMKKLRERSRRKIIRKINEKLITWDGQQFIYKDTKLPVENIQFKKNKDDDDDDDEDEDLDDSFDNNNDNDDDDKSSWSDSESEKEESKID